MHSIYIYLSINQSTNLLIYLYTEREYMILSAPVTSLQIALRLSGGLRRRRPRPLLSHLLSISICIYVYIYVCISIPVSVYICIFLSIYLSNLSLSIHIYISI